MKSILVPVEDHDRMRDVILTALIAAECYGSYVEGVPLGPDVAELVAADFSMSGIVFDDRTRRAFLQNAANLFLDVVGWRAIPRRDGDTDGVSYGWRGDALVSPTAIGEYGRIFDLIVVGRPGSGSEEPSRSTFEAVLFESGRPLLLVPPKRPTSLGQVTAIAWNGSSETARSIAFAMPFLQRAKDVAVLAVPGLRLPGPSDAQIAASLRRHGIPARVVAVAEDGRAPGKALLETASDLGCDLMIKGGYTQSRIRQIIFGSVTSDILAAAELPIFMAH